jgi:CRP/FNR family transcriptional regulator
MYWSTEKTMPCRPNGGIGLERHLKVDARELARAEAMSAPVELDRNECLFMNGDRAKYVFMVLDGALRLSKTMADGRRLITSLALGGDFVGLAAEDTYDFTAETLLPSRLCRMPKQDFDRLIDDCPQLRTHLVAYSKGELQRVQDRMMLLGRKTGAERLAAFLLQLAERAAGDGAERARVALPMGRADIADYLGLTIETVSRLIREFERSGLLRLSDLRTVELPNLHDLRRIAHVTGKIRDVAS